jgi:ABC-2 type transport system permease protein
MSFSRMFKVLAKDIRMSPRNGSFYMALLMPVLMTLLIQGVFGSLFDPDPRLGVIDYGDSELTAAVQELDGMEVSLFEDEALMKEQIESNDLDGGSVLPAGCDEDLRAGDRPEMGFWLGGESLASNRLVLSVTAIDLIREVEGAEAPVEGVETVLGEENAVPLSDRLTSFVVFYALIIGSLYVPAMGLVEEREQGTLSAMLVSPVKLAEVFWAKGIFGVILGAILVVVSLALNGAWEAMSVALVLAIMLGAVMSMLIGLIYAALSKDATQLYTFVKGFGIILMAPVAWHIWPDLPQWLAKVFPTYWFINPIYEISILGKDLGDVGVDLVIGVGVAVVLGAIAVVLARRMQFKIAAE